LGFSLPLCGKFIGTGKTGIFRPVLIEVAEIFLKIGRILRRKLQRSGNSGTNGGGGEWGRKFQFFLVRAAVYLECDFQHVTCSDVKRYRFTTFVTL
jgi:hypothetical protein